MAQQTGYRGWAPPANEGEWIKASGGKLPKWQKNLYQKRDLLKLTRGGILTAAVGMGVTAIKNARAKTEAEIAKQHNPEANARHEQLIAAIKKQRNKK